MRGTISQALGIILPLCVLSILLAGAVISVANDMYAFVKKDTEITLEISQGSSLHEISELLGENGVVNNPDIFYAYVKSKGKAETVEEFFGDITLNSAMSYREILSLLI